MVVRLMAKRRKIEDKIKRVFYDYGRLCAAHPKGCMSISIVTILFLSYPAISKLGLPVSSPIDVCWTSGDQAPEEQLNTSSIPDWLGWEEPTLYIQQIIVKGSVEPWLGNLSAVSTVRASVYQSFNLLKILNQTKLESSLLGIADFCFRGTLSDRRWSGLLPHKSCILLSPSLFWRNNLELFEKDSNVVNTIFKQYCSPSMCPRDIMLGTLVRLTGIKQQYRTNRVVGIEYAMTLIQHEYNAEWRHLLIERLKSQYRIVTPHAHAQDEETLIHVFYRPRKYVSDYLPLLLSYLLCAFYFYFTVNKFQMVKSKWGLALAAFATVFTTLSSTAGICAHFELSASFWRASIFPYLAMIVGLENVLCITRSVVYTSPSLDVSSRLAHGLSFEGYSITKYFIMELLFLTLGYFTQVSQIQEFCVFAFIGLCVDLYMQLFFYAPCLTYDLSRMDCEDKQRFSLMLFDADIRQLKQYPNPKCPARYFFPSLFARKSRLVRTCSETGISMKGGGSKTITYRGHRRCSSTDKNVQKLLNNSSLVSNRLRLLYFWTRTRIVQRAIMAFFCIWVLWLAFVVHKWKLVDGLVGGATNGTTMNQNSPWIRSPYYLDTAPLEFVEWSKNTFKWWPALFAEYNLSLSGRYITFLPPIVLESAVNALDPMLITRRRKFKDDPLSIGDNFEESGPELKNRIYWIEQQVTTMLVFSTLTPFSMVVIFIVYACFWDSFTAYINARRSAAQLKVDKKRSLIDKKGFVELAPLAFSRHESPIECACVDLPNTIVSASVNGHLFIWDSRSGELRNSIQRSTSSHRQHPNSNLHQANQQRPIYPDQQQHANFIPNEPSPKHPESNSKMSNRSRQSKSLIWCLAVRNNIIALGCSDGIVQLAHSISARLLGTFNEPSAPSGIIHIELRGQRVIFVRLNGVLEIVDYKLTEGPPDEQRVEFSRLSSSKMHKKPVTKLLCCAWKIITASEDHTLKVFDSRSMSVSNVSHWWTLNGHLAPVVSACLSKDEKLLFSSCDAGRICCWSIEDGQLLRSADQASRRFLELACTTTLLIGFGGDSKLWFWDLQEGHTVAELSLQDQVQPLTLLLDIDDGIEQSLREPRYVAVLSDQYIVTCDADSVQIWDTQLTAIIKQVRLPGFVDSVQRLDSTSALCCSGTEMFEVSLPIPLKKQR